MFLTETFRFLSLFLGSKFVIIELSKEKKIDNKYKLQNFKDNIDYKPTFKGTKKCFKQRS